MKKKTTLFLFLVLGLLSLIPMFPDPFYHEQKVNFWVWIYREVQELLHGEKN